MIRKAVSRYLSLFMARAYIALYRRSVTIKPLSAAHVEEVTRILSEQFCQREPLCRNLGMSEEALLPFFREQVNRAAALDLGLVALNTDGKVVGAVTNEDHADPYVPTPQFLTPEFNAIGALLDELKLPTDCAPQSSGQVFYCALAAVEPRQVTAPVLSLLIAGICLHMEAKGYSRGYAKITNPRVIANMQKIERIMRQKIFTLASEKSDTDFAPGQFAPLNSFRIALVHWKILFWSF